MTAVLTRLGSALLTAVLAAAAAVALAPAAGALPATIQPVAPPRLTDATASAADLRARVDKLTTAAAVASEDYADSQAELGNVMNRHLLAQRQLRDAQASSADTSEIADDRIRALYMTGGKAGLISSVLDARDLGDIAARLNTVKNLVDADRTRVVAGVRVSGQAAAVETQLGQLSAQKLALQDKSAAAAARVATALSATQRLLVTADATVRRMAEEQRAAAAAAAARAFAEQLAAARDGAGLAGLGPGVAPSARATAAIAAARTRLGLPYVWGATGPNSFDCSGLTGWAYRQAGLSLPRTSRQQWFAGRQIGLADLAPGDLLFWGDSPPTIHHEAMYLGGGLMIVAPRTGTVVRVQAVYSSGYLGAVRPGA